MELKAGKVGYREDINLPLPHNLFLRVVIMATASLLIFGGGAVLILGFIDPMTIDFTTGLVIKAIYGVALSIVITPIAVMATLKK